MDTAAHLQLEVEALKSVQSGPSTSATAPPVKRVGGGGGGRGAQLSLNRWHLYPPKCLYKFSGVTSLDQYRQVFDAIVW